MNKTLTGKRVRIKHAGMDLPASFVGKEGTAKGDVGLSTLGMASGEYWVSLDSGEVCYVPAWKLEGI